MYTNFCAVEQHQHMFLEVLTILVFSRSNLVLEDFNLPSLDVTHNNDYIWFFFHGSINVTWNWEMLYHQSSAVIRFFSLSSRFLWKLFSPQGGRIYCIPPNDEPCWVLSRAYGYTWSSDTVHDLTESLVTVWEEGATASMWTLLILQSWRDPWLCEEFWDKRHLELH